MITNESEYWNERYNTDERNTNIYYENIGWQSLRPSTCYKPRLFIDGNQWCALLGENIQDGVCGFGDSPYKALLDFDKSFDKDLNIGGVR